MPNITVEFDSAPIVDLLGRLSAGLSPAGLAVPLKDIGEHLAESTRRFIPARAGNSAYNESSCTREIVSDVRRRRP
jgi:hypothetical protein